MESSPVGGTSLQARVAAAVGCPVILCIDGNKRYSVQDYFNETVSTGLLRWSFELSWQIFFVGFG